MRAVLLVKKQNGKIGVAEAESYWPLEANMKKNIGPQKQGKAKNCKKNKSKKNKKKGKKK